MLNFCLPPDRVNEFISAFKSNKVDPANLAKLSSEERNQIFAGITGDLKTAKLVNAEFESKMILKNQQAGYIRWAKDLTGITQTTRRDLITKIAKLDSVLSPQDEKAFLNELANKKLGFEVTDAEAKSITELSHNIQTLDSARLPDGTFATNEARMAYGRSVVKMDNYVSDLKHAATKLKAGDIFRPSKYLDITSSVAGNMKSASASLDNSAVFRQGWKTMMTHPTVWAKDAVKTFGYLAKELGGKNVMNEIRADIISRPNFDRYATSKLAVYKPEEQFPSSALEKMPGLGRLYKASESAYTGFVYKLRADLMDVYINKIAQQGMDINNPEQLRAMAKVANSLTGRASIGKLEPVGGVVNNIFFSPRFFKSNLDVLTAHAFSAGMTPIARKEAALNLAKLVAGTAAIMGSANLIRPGSVDLDPRSTDFGKIKIGDTRFDITGGMGSIIVLSSRLISGQSKTSAGQIKSLYGGGYGSPTVMDALSQFIRNKLSPAAGLVTDIVTRQDALGNPITPGGEAARVVTPISIQNAIEVWNDPNSADKLATIIADGLGINTNTYGVKSSNSWNGTTSKELLQFKDKIGQDKFNAANKSFSADYSAFVNKVKTDAQYKNLSEQDKTNLLNKKQAQLKDDLYKKYNFTYVTQKSDKSTINSLLK